MRATLMKASFFPFPQLRSVRQLDLSSLITGVIIKMMMTTATMIIIIITVIILIISKGSKKNTRAGRIHRVFIN